MLSPSPALNKSIDRSEDVSRVLIRLESRGPIASPASAHAATPNRTRMKPPIVGSWRLKTTEDA